MTLKLNGSSSGSVSIDAPASTTSGADITFKLPVADGTSGQVLQTDASGQLSFTGNGGSGRKVLEQFFTPCDGSVIATSAGNVTVPNVSSAMTGTTSYADLTGSPITYTPPSGATQVIYDFNFHSSGVDSTPMWHMKLFLAGAEVVYARQTHYKYLYDGNRIHFKWGFNIGGSADANVGRVASWSSGKEIKLQWREYNTSSEPKFHETYYWDAAVSSQFSIPCIGITAIG